MLSLPCAALAAVFVVAVSGPRAHAQPADAAPACAIELVRVPDDVRGVVEQWIRAEPRCSHALEVRIAPTEGGLYVLARDDAGRFHERVVPDATSAGVLIVSWAADDGPSADVPSLGPSASRASSLQSPQSAASPRPVPIRTPAVPPARTAAVSPSATAAVPPARAAAPPSAAAAPEGDRTPDRPRLDLVFATAAPRAPHPIASPRWMSAGGMLQVAARGAAGGETLYGGRAEIDLWTPGRWTIGAAATLARSQRAGYFDTGLGARFDTLVRSFDASAVLRAGITARFGAWELVPAIGAGGLYSYNYNRRYPYTESSSTVSVIGEASLTAAYRVSGRLAIATGLIATVYAPTGAASSAAEMDLHLQRTAGFAVIEGLRWAL